MPLADPPGRHPPEETQLNHDGRLSGTHTAPKTDGADGEYQRHAADDNGSGKARSQETADAPAVDPVPVSVQIRPGLPAGTAKMHEQAGEASARNSDRAAAAAALHGEQTRAPEGDAADGGQRSCDGVDSDEDSVPSEALAAVAFWYRRDPSMHPTEIAAKIGRSERTVLRYWPPTSQRAINGHETRRLADRLRPA